MLQSRLQGQHGRARAAAERLRVQLLVGFLFAVCLPAIIGVRFDLAMLDRASSQNSIVASAVALTVGVLLFRRFRRFPGVRVYEYVLPSFFTSYGLVVAVMLALRLNYVVSTLLGSFVMSVITMFVLCYIGLRKRTYLFHVVPAGDVSRLDGVGNAQWLMMTEPTLPASADSGIVVDLRADLDDSWERMLAEAALAGVPVYHIKQLLESITGQLQIEHISENGLGSLTPNEGYGKLKQFADIASAIILLPLLLPVLMLVAIVIRLDSPGPVLFQQQRMGFRGRPFSVLKFRTMKPADQFVAGEEARKRAMTLTDDQRITRVGRFLRRTRIDEIPQILNVLRGEMSWIGPRPEAMSLSSWYQQELPFYSYRHVVKPGITGWAQVNQGHVAEISDVHHKLCYDFYYIKYLSAWLDALILFRTVRTVITGSGSK
ncbi:exopolysaccharide biosynthesis polyprenyl glycosylphosphotransferase [Sphingomonas sp. PB4P5]|uniref:exopolysaccharide biosynthesis polyprenyl glycosylphosphotransferase n=1 Tax=Parasphingomonas puruogangriensis TaxID=3096155 RepID=UPI002FC5AE8F